MATEELRLEATVVDRFSTPLAKLRTALGAVKPPAGVVSSTKDFERFHAAVTRSTQAIQSGYTQAIGGLGVQSIFAAGAIAGLTASISRFVSSTGELKALSRETGITVQTFRNLKAVADQFQSSPETIEKGLRQFGSNLADFRRGLGSTYAEILKVAPDMARKLREASPDKAVDIVLGELARDKNRQRAARISELLFGTRDFERLTGHGAAELRRALADAQKRIGVLTPEDEKRAMAFEQAIGRLQQSFSGLATTLGSEFAPPMTKAIEAIDKLIQDSKGEFGKGLSDGIREVGQTLAAFDWSILTGGLGAVAGYLREIGAALKVMDLIGKGEYGGACKEFKDWGQRSGAAKSAIDAARAEVEARKKTLSEFDKSNPGDARRRWHEENLRSSEEKLRKAIEEGAKVGVKDGLEQIFQRSSYGGFGGGGAQIWNASYGGGGGMGPGRRSAAAVGRAMRDVISGGSDAPGSMQPGGGAADGGAYGGARSPAVQNGGKLGKQLAANYTGSNAEILRKAADELGTSPKDLATVISYETGGTFRTNIWGGKGGRYMGLIQFGPSERAKYGAHERQTFGEQMGAVVRYLKDRGFKPGMSLMDLYSTINAGRPGRYGASDGNGTVRSHTARMIREHSGNANRFLAADGQRAAGGAFNAAREAGNFGANQQVGPTGRAELEVTINGLPHGWKSRADGGDLFRDVKVGRGRSMALAPDEP
ncbi:MAG: hypothetical protein KF904_17920 [Rhodoblastus sp.]|nr:hypothetical protein [Rhodoblastus sp.]